MKGKAAADLKASLFVNSKLFTYPYPSPVLSCPSHIAPAGYYYIAMYVQTACMHFRSGRDTTITDKVTVTRSEFQANRGEL